MPRLEELSMITRAAANSEGDWAKVPLCVREAIMVALASVTLPNGFCRQDSAESGDSSFTRVTAPRLTEEALQRSVQTFEDASFLRTEAVRCYAHFHNTVEGLREMMQSQLYALWRTALQLDPDHLNNIGARRGLGLRDFIPNDVTIEGDALKRLTRLESLLHEMNNGVEILRAASVRFAASVLSDDEKQSMGLDPMNLRPEDAPFYATPVSTDNSFRGTAEDGVVGQESYMDTEESNLQ
ncbi:hypothetical protein ERJ75_000255000 [Trypanosoma vivax]|uniref:Uncharacterized protein n=1 Tax=Trypanosoma vivax (strain Y486) TaxID=1055687 RepID=G0U1Z0_TRYVY|nr:hypothetical protein TRVL_09792 [Trypanosoma vivax]KAH8618787.1 hypothetical protein ERJ75_000255000 [Trypanosoma vivax]CCC50291.1 conserved hypothetical protein [Trypanosoma vivax Y486]